MGFETPKQYAVIGKKTVLEHSIDKLLKVSAISKIFVGVSPDDAFYPSLSVDSRVQFYFGGSERADTVRLGLEHLPEDSWVLVHDAARPFVDSGDIERLIASCFTKNCPGLLATPATDTIKQSSDTNVKTLDRNTIWFAQTPQMAPVAQLKLALQQAQSQSLTVTDEASALELQGEDPLLCSANKSNIKLTDSHDWMIGQLIAKQQGLL
jgi:2-C-methyl-D-erythritol 4-phosphate cytidylyltransferase